MNHVFLTGFMGAGKSTVGRLVATRLGRPFVDLDAEIEGRESTPVSELFRTRGEAGFRDAEHAALEALAGREPSVVATGGGVVLREDNQALLRRHGRVVYLAVTPEEAMGRLGDAGDRPLLAGGGLAAARSILGARLGAYEKTADFVVDTTALGQEGVADAVVAVLCADYGHHRVRVGSADDHTSYEVVIGSGLLGGAGERIRTATGASMAAIVSDETVWGLYGSAVAESLADAGIRAQEFVVPPGEESKSWETAGSLLERFAASRLDRASVVIALGGGVVGDLAGFCAACYMRGVTLVQLPTTLLAQVDSAIGGKTAVDLRAGKNLAGAFWPPALVLSDTSLLATLPEAEWTNGLVEMAKAALLAGEREADRFEAALPAVLAREPGAVCMAVADAADFKAAVVAEDLRESDVRECLNLGHTLGHALEVLIGYGALPHGLAVAEGMRFAGGLAETLVGADPALLERTRCILESIGAGSAVCTPALAPLLSRTGPVEILAAMKGDKKSRDGVVRFVMLERPGRWQAVGVDDAVLLAALERWAAEVTGGGN